MRLSKKIAAVALAAVMAVSMLTACGGTDAPSSSRPSSSRPSSSSSSSSSSGGTTDSSSSGSSSGSSSSSSTEDKEETIAYKNSRTAKFYQKLGTNYTMGLKMDITSNGVNQTGTVLISTNGNRVYEEVAGRSDDGDVENGIILIDQAKRQSWVLVPDESVKDQGKLGYYRVQEIGDSQPGDGSMIKPSEGIKFTQKTEGNYYIETQTYEVPVGDDTAKMTMAYYFVKNSVKPKFVVVDESVDGKISESMRMEFTSVEYQANKKYMDFEALLKQYINVSEMLGAASMPSIASLTIG